MNWDYRILAKKKPSGFRYGIYKVRFDDKGNPLSHKKKEFIVGAYNLEEFKYRLKKIDDAFDKPILSYDNFPKELNELEYVDGELVTLDDIAFYCCKVADVDYNDLITKRRVGNTPFVRKLVCYVGRIIFNMPYQDIANYLDIPITSVYHRSNEVIKDSHQSVYKSRILKMVDEKYRNRANAKSY